MPNSKLFRRAASVIGAAAVLAASPAALAHTTAGAQATEGVSADNSINIGHGCEMFDLGVTAQSVVFPTSFPRVTGSDGSSIANLGAVITQGSLAGLARPIQNRSIFRSRQLKTDDLGNVTGFSATRGMLTPDFPGKMPFQFTAPNFVTTSCAKRLLIQIAVADICAASRRDTVAGVEEGKVNLWIPDNGSQFAIAGAQVGADGIGEPATLIVNRNVATNPLPSSCGAGIDVTVTPSPSDVDANLPIPGFWELMAGTAPVSVAVIEYYQASLDHYFMTWDPDEIATLDAGTDMKGWARTGKTLQAYTAAQTGTSPVCRYYIPPALGDSHFFGRGTAECTATAKSNPSFVLEDPAFMQMFLPVAGVCPAATTPVYRVFSNRKDANHRYMTDRTTRDQMVAKGWLAEGDGPDRVAMCAPQ